MEHAVAPAANVHVWFGLPLLLLLLPLIDWQLQA
jgi:hypothetical protein